MKMSALAVCSVTRTKEGTIISADPEIAAFTSAESIGAVARVNSDVLAPREERRSRRRMQTAFRPACIVTKGRIALGLLRNISQDGAMIEIDEKLNVGDRVAYFWDEQRLIDARVVRVDGNRYGLANDDEQRADEVDRRFRSVRVPCTVEADIWVGGEHHRARIANLSLGGMQAYGITARKGAPLTIRFAGIELCNACVVWSKGGRTGIRFEQRLSRSQLAATLSHDSVRFDELLFD